MSTTRVLHLDAYRGRRQQRVERTLALLAPDPVRHRLGILLARLLQTVGGDRAAVVWADEFGPLVPRPHVLLDLHAEAPRRGFDARLLNRAWSLGVPGPLDLPDLPRAAVPELPRSTVWVALGSDGLRNWFAVVDSVAPREILGEAARAHLLHLTGECAAVILHRELLETEERPGRAEGFTGWTVLTDLDGRDDDARAQTRIGERFLVLRFVRFLLDEDLAPDPESLGGRLDGLRDTLKDEDERALWLEVVEAARAGEHARLAEAVVAVGLRAEDLGELEGAVEAFRSAYWVAALCGAPRTAVDAARYLGRSLRRTGRWDDSEEWYVQSAGIARSIDWLAGLAIAMDGQAATLRARGNVAAWRRVLGDALAVAQESRDPYALGSVHQNLMTAYHLAGEAAEAVEHGWASVQGYDTPRDRLRALVSLAGVLLDMGAVRLAEEAYELAVERVDEGYFRAYALEGYAHAAALRGDRAEYEQRYRRVHAQGWAAGGLEFQAQAYVYRGRAYEALGDIGEAGRWYHKAIGFARRAKLRAQVLEAEEALGRLERGQDERGSRGPAPLALPERALEAVQGGLGALRRELASVAS